MLQPVLGFAMFSSQGQKRVCRGGCTFGSKHVIVPDGSLQPIKYQSKDACYDGKGSTLFLSDFWVD